MICKDTQAAIAATLERIKEINGGTLADLETELMAYEIAAAVVPGFLEQLQAARRIIEHRRDSDSEVAG